MTRTALLFAVTLAVATVALAGEDGRRLDGPGDSEITAFVEQLGDADFRARERATKRLLEIGPASLRALRNAPRSDVEIRYRARRISRRILGRSTRLTADFEREVEAIYDETDLRIERASRETAEKLEPIRDSLTRSQRLDEAMAVRAARRTLLGLSNAPGGVDLPPDAEAVAESLVESLTEAEQDAAARAKRRRTDLFTSLGTLRVSLEKDGEQEAARAVGQLVEALDQGIDKVLDDPGSIRQLDTTVGRVFFVRTTGAKAGSVWGSDLYTTDSALAVAAVHAGVLREGETGTVKISVLAGRNSYEGTTRNGVTTSSWGSYGTSFRVAKATGLLKGMAIPEARGLPAVSKLLTDYEEDVAAIEEQHAKRSTALRRQAAADLEPIQEVTARNARLVEALAVRSTRRWLSEDSSDDRPAELPPSASRIVREHERRASEIEKKTTERVRERRRAAVARLQLLRADFAAAEENEAATAIESTIVAMRNGYSKAIPDPGSVGRMKAQPGRSHYVKVTGARNGSVWGSDVYTTDSTIAAAAVHAGVLKVGQTAVVKITVLPGQPAYVGTERNGVTTSAWGAYPMSYRVRRVFGGPQPAKAEAPAKR